LDCEAGYEVYDELDGCVQVNGFRDPPKYQLLDPPKSEELVDPKL
jgi:hypothetical protein